MELFEHVQLLQAALLANPRISDLVFANPEQSETVILDIAVSHACKLHLDYTEVSTKVMKRLQKEKFQKIKKEENEG